MNREIAKKCVGDGWSSLIDEFFDSIPEEAEIISVKEKYGMLQIDGFGYDIDKELEISSRSSSICEVCGENGELREDMAWIKTLCDKHYGN